MTTPIFATNSFENVARRFPIAVIFDWSWSMRHYIDHIQRTLNAVPSEFDAINVLRNSGELALITMFGDGVQLRTGERDVSPYGFQRSLDFVAPTVECDGISRLDLALDLAVDLIEARSADLRGRGRRHFAPFIGIVSDGHATDATGAPSPDNWRPAADRARAALGGRIKTAAFVPEGCSSEPLEAIADEVHALDAAQFAQVMRAVSFSAGDHARRGGAVDVARADLQGGDVTTTRGGA